MKAILVAASLAAVAFAAYAAGSANQKVMEARRIAERMVSIGIQSVTITGDGAFRVVLEGGETHDGETRARGVR